MSQWTEEDIKRVKDNNDNQITMISFKLKNIVLKKIDNDFVKNGPYFSRSSFIRIAINELIFREESTSAYLQKLIDDLNKLVADTTEKKLK